MSAETPITLNVNPQDLQVQTFTVEKLLEPLIIQVLIPWKLQHVVTEKELKNIGKIDNELRKDLIFCRMNMLSKIVLQNVFKVYKSMYLVIVMIKF